MAEQDRSRPIEAERAVLGAFFIDERLRPEVAAILSPDDFSRDAHRRIYRTLLEVDATRGAIDWITVKNELLSRGELDEVGGPAYLAGLTDGVPRSTNAPYYARIVKEGSRLRSLRALAERTIATIDAGGVDGATSADLVEGMEGELARLAAQTPSGWHSGGDLAADAYRAIEQACEAQAHGQLRGCATGFDELDVLTSGFQRGDLILLGARPSMGKTAFALHVAWFVAKTAPVAILTLEMERTAVALRMVISDAQINSWRVLSGRVDSGHGTALSRSLEALGSRQLWIDDTAFVSPQQARAKLRQLQARVGRLGLVVIDYLQLMAPMAEQRRENRATQVAGISRMLKVIARELETPMLVLSQLNREVEQRSEKRPSLGDLRESGALEQDADLVLLLYRPEYYQHDDAQRRPQDEGIAHLILAKNRNGPTGDVELVWLKEQMRFANLARQASSTPR